MQPDLKWYDMERVEVLRGPQGTLYGSGTMGGAVRNIPKAPNLEKFESEFQVGISGTDGADDINNKLTGVINVPLSEDKLALRVVGYHFENQGYIDMVTETDPTLVGVAAAFGGVVNTNEEVNDTQFSGIRASLLWQATDDFSATLTYANQQLEQDGVFLVSGEDGYERVGLGLNGKYGDGVEEGRESDFDFTNLIINYDLGWADLLSSSTTSTASFERRLDITFAVGLPIGLQNQVEAKGFTQELRLSSKLEGPFQFLAGFYYEDLENENSLLTAWTGEDALNLFATPTPMLDMGLLALEIEQKALFGELSYDITERLVLTLGARWFDYDRRRFQDQTGVLFGPVSSDESVSEDGSNGKVNVAYSPDQDTLIYAQWAQGFRLGKPTQVQPKVLCDSDDDGILDGTSTPFNEDGFVKSDNIDSYELGGKFGLMDNRLVINGAIYRIDWEDIPARAFNSTFTCATDLNAGEARSQGLELEANLYLTDDLRVDLGVGYVDAELTSGGRGLGSDGDRLPFSPRFNASFGLDYNFDFREHDSYINLRYSYVGGSHTDFAELSTEMGDYGKVDLRAGLAINDQLDIGIYGTNLTNSDELAFVYAFGNYRQTPRQLGLNVSYRFH